MNPSSASGFPAKIILFGEYSVLLGGDVIALPAFSKQGRLDYLTTSGDDHESARLSNQRLGELLDHLLQKSQPDYSSQILDLERIQHDVAIGLFFRSEIPVNWGMGSSGALVAALYDEYAWEMRKRGELESIREDLAWLESFFHSRSSGIDPLVSFLKHPLLVKSGRMGIQTDLLEKVEKRCNIFLLDTGQPGITRSGVADFWQQCITDHHYQKQLESDYLPLVNHLIEDILSDTNNSLSDSLGLLGRKQLLYFNRLFPHPVGELARIGLETARYTIKLCGSGGGGYFLVLTEDPHFTSEKISEAGFPDLIPLVG